MAEEHEEWTPYQKMEAGILKDISCDTDEILRKLEGKNMGEGFDSGALMGMLANKGVDPGIVAMLNDKCRDGGWGEQGGIWIVLLFLFLLGIGGGNGFFGRNGLAGEAGVAGVDRTVVNEANYSRLLDAMNAQGTRQEMAIQGLANALNCDCNEIRSALCSIGKEIAVNQGSVINAIQSCCCNVQQAVKDCCCQTNLNIERQGCQTRADIQDVRFLISSSQAAQDNLIQSLFSQQNAYLADQFCQIKMRELENTNQRLRDEIFRQSQQSQTAQIIQAIRGMDTVNFSGTAGTTAFSGTGSIN